MTRSMRNPVPDPAFMTAEPFFRDFEHMLFGIFMLLILIMILILLLVALLWKIDKEKWLRVSMEKQEQIDIMNEKDYLTGAGSIGLLEKQAAVFMPEDYYAFLTVGVAHEGYLRRKYLEIERNAILISLVEQLYSVFGRDIAVYRISDSVFFAAIRKESDMEKNIFQLKEAFREEGRRREILQEASAGYVMSKETPVLPEESVPDNDGKQDLLNSILYRFISRCEEIRELDEQLIEDRFIEGMVSGSGKKQE